MNNSPKLFPSKNKSAVDPAPTRRRSERLSKLLKAETPSDTKNRSYTISSSKKATTSKKRPSESDGRATSGNSGSSGRKIASSNKRTKTIKPALLETLAFQQTSIDKAHADDENDSIIKAKNPAPFDGNPLAHITENGSSPEPLQSITKKPPVNVLADSSWSAGVRTALQFFVSSKRMAWNPKLACGRPLFSTSLRVSRIHSCVSSRRKRFSKSIAIANRLLRRKVVREMDGTWNRDPA